MHPSRRIILHVSRDQGPSLQHAFISLASSYILFRDQTLTPLGVIFIIWVVPSAVNRCSPIDLKMPEGFQGKMTILFLELVLPSVSRAIFQTFVCSRYDGAFFLRAQLSLACDDSWSRRGWVIYAVVCLVAYPICFPLMLFGILFGKRSDIATRVRQLKDATETDIVALSSQRRSTATVERSRRIAVVEFKVMKYDPGMWWFDPFLLLNRLLLIMVSIMFERADVRVVIASCISICCIIVQRELEPYFRDSDDTIAYLAQWVLLLWCQSLIMMQIVTGDRGRQVVGAFQIMLPVTLCLTVARFVHRDYRASTRAPQRNMDVRVSSSSTWSDAAELDNDTETCHADKRTSAQIELNARRDPTGDVHDASTSGGVHFDEFPHRGTAVELSNPMRGAADDVRTAVSEGSGIHHSTSSAAAPTTADAPHC